MMGFSARQARITLVFIALLVIGVGTAVYSRYSRVRVPDEFVRARSQGAVISENIVGLSNQLSNDLARVNALDNQGRYGEAVAATDALIAQSKDVRYQAGELSKQLEAMTQSLDYINSSDARDAALASIAARVTMIQSLLAYSDALTQMLTRLKGRFVGNIQQLPVAENVTKINAEIEQINKLNVQAAEAMKRFDDIVAGKN